MYKKTMLQGSIVEHMESRKLFNEKKCVSKSNIVLSVSNKLNMQESQDYLIEQAFDDLVRIDMIRSNCVKYNDEGEAIRYVFSTQEERFYLNK